MERPAKPKPMPRRKSRSLNIDTRWGQIFEFPKFEGTPSRHLHSFEELATGSPSPQTLGGREARSGLLRRAGTPPQGSIAT